MKIRAKKNAKELALILGVTQQTISYRLKSLGMIQKQRNWVPYEPSRETLNATCEMLLARHKLKRFLHRISVTDSEKWIHYDNSKKRKSWGPLLQHRQPSQIFMEKNLYCVFGEISLVSCIMNCSNRMRPLLGLSTEHN